MKERVIQFGTGNFLRGFADAFIDRLNKGGFFDGSVVIVSPTDSKNIDKINSQHGRYNLVLRGIENGKTVNERFEIEESYPIVFNGCEITFENNIPYSINRIVAEYEKSEEE